MNFIYEPCDICKPSGGKYLFKIDDNGDEYVEKCECFIKYSNDKTLYLKLLSAGFKADFLFNYKLSDYIGNDNNKIKDKAQKYIDNFDTKFNNISLYFYSKENGTQKTTIASYIGRELLKKNKTVMFILMNDLLEKLKFDFDRSKEEEQEYKTWYDNILNCDLLIIDDSFDKKTFISKSGYGTHFIDNFLRQRLESINKSIIFTSNVTTEEIDETKFSISVKELVKRNTVNCVFEFTDKIDKIKTDFDVGDLWN